MLIGCLDQDPEMRITPSGRPVTSFCLGAARSWLSADGQLHEETEWFNVVAWGQLAEICKKRLSRGNQVYVEGRLQTRSWEDDHGRTHYRTEVVAGDVIVLADQSGFSDTANE
jgi:single-strand DNA-binding protein